MKPHKVKNQTNNDGEMESSGCAFRSYHENCSISIAEKENVSLRKSLAAAEQEIQTARQEAELAKQALQEALYKAEQALAEALAEADKQSQAAVAEAEITNQALNEALSKAEDARRSAMADVTAMKRTLKEALAGAQDEIRIAKEEADAAKDALKKVLNQPIGEKSPIENGSPPNETLEQSLAEILNKSVEARANAEAARKSFKLALAKAKRETQYTLDHKKATEDVLTEALAQAEQERWAAKLEAKNQIDSLKSENAALKEALKQANEESRAVEETSRKIYMKDYTFVSDVMYKLRTPLQSIIGFSKLLADGSVNDQEMLHECLTTIDKESERVLRLVGELADLVNMRTVQGTISDRNAPTAKD